MNTQEIVKHLSNVVDTPYRFRGQIYNVECRPVEITTVWKNESMAVLKIQGSNQVIVIDKEHGALIPNVEEIADLQMPLQF